MLLRLTVQTLALSRGQPSLTCLKMAASTSAADAAVVSERELGTSRHGDVLPTNQPTNQPTRAHQPPPCRRQPRTHRARPLSPFAVVDPFCLRQFNGQKEPKVDMTVEAFEQEGTVGHGRAWYGMAWCTCITR